MKFTIAVFALSASMTFAAPFTGSIRDDGSSGLGGALNEVESYLPIVGGNEGPIIPGLGGDKVRRQDDGLGGLLNEVESYLPILGGNEGPIIPGLGGDKVRRDLSPDEQSALQNLISMMQGYLNGSTKFDLGDFLNQVESFLPILGGNEGPIIPGLGGDKVRRDLSPDEQSAIQSLINTMQGYLNGSTKFDLGDFLNQVESFLPIVGGNEGPIIPGLGGDK